MGSLLEVAFKKKKAKLFKVLTRRYICISVTCYAKGYKFKDRGSKFEVQLKAGRSVGSKELSFYRQRGARG